MLNEEYILQRIAQEDYDRFVDIVKMTVEIMQQMRDEKNLTPESAIALVRMWAPQFIHYSQVSDIAKAPHREYARKVLDIVNKHSNK